MKGNKRNRLETLKSEDSRKDDFGSEEDNMEGSDTVQLVDLRHKIEACKPSMSERYNEYKVDQGLQDRLEDSELPEDLENEETYEEWKQMHEQQMKATEDRKKRAERQMELTRMREAIVQAREEAKRMEWEADMLEKEKSWRKIEDCWTEGRKRGRSKTELRDNNRSWLTLNMMKWRKTP